MNKEKFIINLFVYNSYKNLKTIFKHLYLTKININKIIIIDNNSSNSISNKIKIINSINNKYNFNISLIVNKKNYGLGGSHKILFRLLKKEKFDFFLNLGTTNRYYVSEVLKDVIKNTKGKYDYYLFSRFIKKRNTENYNFLRKVMNIFFIKLTKFLTKTNLTDPGSSTMVVSQRSFKKIRQSTFIDITNGSHFTHFLNIKFYNLKLKCLEIPIIWKEGNVKSHLNALSYVFILFFSLIKFTITGNFFRERDNNFSFKTFIL